MSRPPDDPLWGAPAPGSFPSGPAGGATRTNGLAITSFVLGILWLGWIGSVLALLLGYQAKSQIDRSGGRESGRGLAIAGIVLGWVGIATLVLTIAAAIVVPMLIGPPSDAGSDSVDTGDKQGVRRTLERYAQATRDKDYQTICDDLYTAQLAERVRGAGLPCEVALRTALSDRRNPRVEVLAVEVNGDDALARVRSTADGEATSTGIVRLARRGGSWRVASLSGPNAP